MMSDTKLETLVGIIDTVDVPLKGIISEQGNVGGILSNVSLRGYSAFEVAQMCGYDGTEEEWLASLVGPQGYAPQIEVEEIPNGYKMTVIGELDTQTFTVYKGEKGVYIGSDEMPEGYCIQIDPDSDLDNILKSMVQEITMSEITKLNTTIEEFIQDANKTYLSTNDILDRDELDATLNLIF